VLNVFLKSTIIKENGIYKKAIISLLLPILQPRQASTKEDLKMSELKMNKISPKVLNIARFTGIFSNRFIVTFIAMNIAYAIISNMMGFNISDLAPFLFNISCIVVTSVWSYYLLQITQPLIYRSLRKGEKNDLIRTRIIILIALFIARKGVQSQTTQVSGLFLVPLDIILFVAIVSSFVTLVVLLTRKTISNSRRQNERRTSSEAYKAHTGRTYTDRANTDPAREAGKKGEEKVTYELSHLNKSKSSVFHNITVKINGDTQQLDHIIIGENGIYNIETKTYTGSIRIDEFGNWSRDAHFDGGWKGMQNPLAQTQRHRRALVSIFGEQYPIYDIIAMGNEETVLNGVANSPIPILTLGTLQYYIEEKTKGEKIITSSERQALTQKLQDAIIENKTFE
jgi:uncharacterized integral membrane protein